MPRLPHGKAITPERFRAARVSLAERSADIDLAFAVAAPVDLQDFDFLFPTLQTDETKLLPQTPDMPAKLKALGRTMEDPIPNAPPTRAMPRSLRPTPTSASSSITTLPSRSSRPTFPVRSRGPCRSSSPTT
jgi:hypothetical protein